MKRKEIWGRLSENCFINTLLLCIKEITWKFCACFYLTFFFLSGIVLDFEWNAAFDFIEKFDFLVSSFGRGNEIPSISIRTMQWNGNNLEASSTFIRKVRIVNVNSSLTPGSRHLTPFSLTKLENNFNLFNLSQWGETKCYMMWLHF